MSDRLSVRQTAVLQHVWQLNHVEKQWADVFFMDKRKWRDIVENIYASEEHACMYLHHMGHNYRVVLLDPLPRIMAAEQIGLSFRTNYASNLWIVLIKVWTPD